MKIHEVAPGVFRLALMSPDHTNVYLAGDVLIDAGGRFDAKRILKALEGRQVAAHVLTHAHFDHFGGSRAICQGLDLALWCGAGDREAVETGNLSQILPRSKGILARIHQTLGGSGHPVARGLREGDEVGEFMVVETPGHTPGHLAFWREADRVLILGDVLFNRNPLSLRKGLQEPFSWATVSPEQNRDSARKLAALEPSVICFGHGAHSNDVEGFQRFVERLSNP
ncbi:MAG: MBL fold metallo-hydrolase [Gemmatimonadota bacterium]|jgi:glyoxylase-like metal-dependent hydrolase (beta-lactamase superfamily II)